MLEFGFFVNHVNDLVELNSGFWKMEEPFFNFGGMG